MKREIKMSKASKKIFGVVAVLIGFCSSVQAETVLTGMPLIHGNDCSYWDRDSGSFKWDLPKGNIPDNLEMVVEETLGVPIARIDAKKQYIGGLRSWEEHGYWAYFTDGTYRSGKALVGFNTYGMKCHSDIIGNGNGSLTWPDHE